MELTIARPVRGAHRRRAHRRRIGLVGLAAAVAVATCAAFVAAGAAAGHAAGPKTRTLTVTTTADLPAATGACAAKSKTCSLRAAVGQANQDSAAGYIDTVKIGAGHYNLTASPSTLTVTATMYLTGSGAAKTVIDGGGLATVLLVRDTAEYVKVSALTLTNGGSPGDSFSRGGGLENDGADMDLVNVRVTNSHVTGFGGGIYNVAGALDLYNSEVTGNSSGSQGQGGGGFEGNGGGISNFGTMDLFDSTVDHNDAQRGAGIDNRGYLYLTETTVSANTARNSGGGIRTANGWVQVKFSTISGNFADSTPALGQPTAGGQPNTVPPTRQSTARDPAVWGGENGGGIVNVGGSFLIGGSIVAGNSDFQRSEEDAPDCYAPATVPASNPPISVSITSERNNIFGAVTDPCNFADAVDGPTDEEWDAYSSDARDPIDPRLGPLQYNSPGTATRTQAPLNGSTAIDGATGQEYAVAIGPGYPIAAANPISPDPWFLCDGTDQRGVKRPVARYSSLKVCDIGAVEY